MSNIDPDFLQRLEAEFGQALLAKNGGDLTSAVHHYEQALELSLGELARASAQPAPPLAEAGGTYPSCWWIEEHVELGADDAMHYCCYNYRGEDGRDQGHREDGQHEGQPGV